MTKNIQSHKGAPVLSSTFSIVIALIVVVGATWLLFTTRHRDPITRIDIAASARKTPAHSTPDVIASTADLYTKYLPLKSELVTSVGDNQNVEPALVQAVREFEIYFEPFLYFHILDSYMSEYQASGTVRHDAVACAKDATGVSTVALKQDSTDTALLMVDVELTDGSTKAFPITVDKHSLKITKIDCSLIP